MRHAGLAVRREQAPHLHNMSDRIMVEKSGDMRRVGLIFPDSILLRAQVAGVLGVIRTTTAKKTGVIHGL